MLSEAAEWYGNRVAFGALGVSLLSAFFSAWALKHSHDQVKEYRKIANAAQTHADTAKQGFDLAQQAFETQIEQGRQSTVWSERSATAAVESSKAASATLYLARRAWITINNVYGNSMDVPPRSVVSIYTNSGITPALLVRYRTSTYISAQTDEPWFALKHLPFQNAPDLGADQIPESIESTAGFETPGPVVQQIRDGSRKYYVFGEITYEDIFGGPHKLRWVYLYHPDTLKLRRFDFKETSFDSFERSSGDANAVA